MTTEQWTSQEYVVLTRAYIHVFETSRLNDPLFWTRLTNIFNAETLRAGEWRRTNLDITAKWYEMRTKIVLFDNLYRKIEDELLNASEEVIFEAAKEEYKSVSDGLEFEYEQPWNILKYVPYI